MTQASDGTIGAMRANLRLAEQATDAADQPEALGSGAVESGAVGQEVPPERPARHFSLRIGDAGLGMIVAAGLWLVTFGVAGIFTASVRDHDLVRRMGGDEYAVVVTEQSRAGTEKVLDRIRSQIPQRRAALGLSTHWGLSAGVAEFPNDGETAEELLEAADRRLYLSRGIHIQPVS